MSAIRERTRLCIIDLPKKLTSRRNLQEHFRTFGDLKNVSVNKDLRTGMVQFSTHFEAQSAKTQGRMYDGKPLNIFWSDVTSLDPRAKEEQGNKSAHSDELWKDDDKECFGIETVQMTARDERKNSAKDMIKQHLKMSGNKQRLVVTGKEKKEEGSFFEKSPLKLGKIGSKSSIVVKKSILNPVNKRKIIRKEENTQRSIGSKQKKVLVIKELTSNKQAASNTERIDLKYKLSLLDERDKEIRKGMVQDSNINTAVAIKGTCPDMCPERERILRQWGHAVATYELIPGTNEMDENRAVKEYIRSSADQEVPLPHDLRPEPVLSMTMNYLINNIITRVDNTDENKAVWYSFCWNRLRSIRKDIILQQLCDMETVKIVEQCARFHICCYDHMWGAEVSGFDDKINTQNLIDCLQTLKHMYEDLAKHGVRCNNEPEFYSYLILLKLKSGDVMWEYQQYSLNIQLSPQVQFAVQAYMAFKNNMYSRYFNLVKKASYLTACLMQRYFNEVRTQALKTMLRAYCLPNKSVGLLSSFIVSSLKFDSTKNALRFCEREEVDVKVDSDVNEDVYISSSSFLIRDKRLPIANAVVGENNPIPEYILHEVTSSFDECGKLISSPIVKSVENDNDSNLSADIPSTDKDNSVITFPVETQQSTFRFSLGPTKAPGDIFAKTLFSTEIGLNSHQPRVDNFKNIDGMTKTKINNDDSIMETFEFRQEEEMVCEESEELQKPITNILHHTNPENELSYKSQFGLNQPFLIPSLTSLNEPNSMNKRNQNEVLNKQSPSLTVLKDPIGFKAESKQKSPNQFSFTFTTNVTKKLNSGNDIHNVKQFLPSETNLNLKTNAFGQISISKKEIDPQHSFSDVKLKEIDSKEKTQTTDDHSKEIELRKEKEFRALLLEKLLKEKAEQEKLQIEENQRLEKIKKRKEEEDYYQHLRKHLSQRCKVINARKYARQWRMKIEKVKKTRADFPLLFQLSVKDHISKWGSIKSIPTNKIFLRAKDRRNTVRIISQLLNSGITDSCKYLGSDLAETLAKSAAKTMKKSTIKPVYWKLIISVPWADNSSSDLSVFNQLMRSWCRQSFYKQEGACLGSVEHVMTSLEILVNMSIHLSDTMHSNNDLQGMDALVFVVLNKTESEKTCIQRLRSLVSCKIKSNEFSVVVMNIGGTRLEGVLKMELHELQEQNIVAHWKVCTWSDPKSILESLHFLADQVDVVPNVCASSLEILLKQTKEDFFDALSSSQLYNDGLLKALKNPNNVIRLYNICLTKLEDLLKSSKLEKYFNFAEEFQPHIPMNESGGPELLCGRYFDDVYKNQLTKLINCVKLSEFSKWPPKSPNRLVKMLKYYCNQVKDMSIFTQIIRMIDLPDGADLQEHLQNVSWLYIVEIWAQCNIRAVLSGKDRNKRLFVVYDKNYVQRLIQKPWWLNLPFVVEET